MSELIYKQDAIKTIKDADVFVAYHEKDPTGEAVDEAIRATKRSVIYDIGILPSAELEIIHCKNCKHRDSSYCPMYYEEWVEIDEGDGYFDADTIIHDWTTDEGFCHCAELRGKDE